MYGKRRPLAIYYGTNCRPIWRVSFSSSQGVVTTPLVGPFTNTCKGGGADANRGPLKFWRSEKNHVNFTPENWVYRPIWFSVGLTVSLGKEGGPEKFCGPKGGDPENFHAEFFCISLPPHLTSERSLRLVTKKGLVTRVNQITAKCGIITHHTLKAARYCGTFTTVWYWVHKVFFQALAPLKVYKIWVKAYH